MKNFIKKNMPWIIAICIVATFSFFDYRPVRTLAPLVGTGEIDDPIEIDTSGTSQIPTKTGLAAVVSDRSPYYVYTAIVSQSGTDDPVAIVLQNTYPVSLSWDRSSPGQYDLDGVNQFPDSATIAFVMDRGWDGIFGNTFVLDAMDDDYIRLLINAGDDFLAPGNEAFVEVRTYY